MSEQRYSSPATSPRLEAWLLVAVIVGCLLAAVAAYAAYRLATAPSMPTPTVPAAGSTVQFVVSSFFLS